MDEDVAAGQGISIYGDYFKCERIDLLYEPGEFVSKLEEAIIRNGMRPGGVKVLQFYDRETQTVPDGFSVTVILYESHVSFHSDPGKNKFNADVYTCNYSNNNDAGAWGIMNFIRDFFGAKEEFVHSIRRR